MKTKSIAILNVIIMATFIGSALQGCDNSHAREEGQPESNVTGKIESAIEARTMYAESNGRKIAYRSIGQGEPLVLCNRFRGILDTWDPAFLDALAKTYRVIIFDYSGFGLSTGTAASDMNGFVTDVKDLAAALSLNKIILGGWSFGGIVAQTAIAEYPDLISHGILIGTGPPGKNDIPVEPIFYEKARILNNSLEDEMVLFFEPAWEASRNAARLSHERIAKRTTDRDVMVPEKLWGNYSLGFAEYIEDKKGIRDKILKSNIPMLVISGDHDISFPVENWYALVRKLQTTQIIVIPMSGHGPQHEYPELVARYITEFLRHIV
jgi:pimeloyl-ACP methyl ester carboxylesterase